MSLERFIHEMPDTDDTNGGTSGGYENLEARVKRNREEQLRLASPESLNEFVDTEVPPIHNERDLQEFIASTDLRRKLRATLSVNGTPTERETVKTYDDIHIGIYEHSPRIAMLPDSDQPTGGHFDVVLREQVEKVYDNVFPVGFGLEASGQGSLAMGVAVDYVVGMRMLEMRLNPRDLTIESIPGNEMPLPEVELPEGTMITFNARFEQQRQPDENARLVFSAWVLQELVAQMADWIKKVKPQNKLEENLSARM